jgi:hypothetical protein
MQQVHWALAQQQQQLLLLREVPAALCLVAVLLKLLLLLQLLLPLVREAVLAGSAFIWRSSLLTRCTCR